MDGEEGRGGRPHHLSDLTGRPFSVSYLDPSFELNEGDLAEPAVCTLVGWEIESRWLGHSSFASERTPEGWRAITHLPDVCIVKKEEL